MSYCKRDSGKVYQQIPKFAVSNFVTILEIFKEASHVDWINGSGRAQKSIAEIVRIRCRLVDHNPAWQCDAAVRLLFHLCP
jgi:hypothetical protein